MNMLKNFVKLFDMKELIRVKHREFLAIKRRPKPIGLIEILILQEFNVIPKRSHFIMPPCETRNLFTEF